MCAPEKTVARKWASALHGGLLLFLLLPLLLAQAPPAGAPATSAAASPSASAPAEEEEPAAAEAAEEAASEAEEPPVVEEEAVKVRPREVKEFSVERVLAEPPLIFEMGGRRDPFAGPNKPQTLPEGSQAGTTKPGKVTIQTPKALSVEEQKALVEKAQELFERMKASIAAQDYRQAIRLHDEELMKIIARKDEVTAPTLKTKLLAIESGAASVEKLIGEAKLNVLHEQIAGLYSLVTASFQGGDYEKVIEHADELEKVFSAGREALLAAPDSQKKQEIAGLKTQADLYRQKAQTRLEFSKKQFVVAGIAWSPQKSFVIVNGKDLTVGAMIDEVKIVGIAPGKITMEFKGETFDKYVE